ncbi:hypothetical protein GVAV_002398 [Gurleya vavrai]
MDDTNVLDCKTGLLSWIIPYSIYREDFLISPIAINNALSICGYKKRSPCLVTPLSDALNNSFDNLNEVCMFLSHIIYRTKGFTIYEESEAEEYPNEVRAKYTTEISFENKSYHGRGYLMLKYPENYLDISINLGMNDLLLKNPDLISKDKKLRLISAINFYKEVVMKQKYVHLISFWPSVNILYNKLEKREATIEEKKEIYDIYVKIAKFFNVKDIIIEKGFNYKKKIYHKFLEKFNFIY